MHIDRGVIIEAVAKGVRSGHLYGYVPTHRILVRRHRTLTFEERLRVTVEACLGIGQSYQFSSVLQFLRTAASGLTGRHHVGQSYTICSQIYLNAFLYGAKKILADVPLDGRVTPGHLASCGDFDDLTLFWVKLST